MAQTPPADEFNPGASAAVESLTVQPDGKILVGGTFTNLGGQVRNRIGRLYPDGSLDESFNPGANATVACFAIQPDGKIVVGGSFTFIGGQSRNKLARLNQDGSLDMVFNPNLGGANAVYCLALQADGKILIGGQFSMVSGQPRRNMARLLSDGTLEDGLSPNATNGNNTVWSIALQPDGKILVGGEFERLAGQSATNIGRLNLDGSYDMTFSAYTDFGVAAIILQPDAKILISGNFIAVNGLLRRGIARLNESGSLDTGFNASSIVNNLGASMILQVDGRIIVGGYFSGSRSGLARLNSNGSIDTGFTSQIAGGLPWVVGISAQADGRILVGGWNFTSLGGQPRNRIGRLTTTSAASQDLNYVSSVVTWLRGGSAPEVSRTTFESSTNSLDWTFLGSGSRILGGWQLTNVSLLPESTIRARGYLTGGDDNGSYYFVESVWPKTAPTINSQDGQLGFQSNAFRMNVSGSAGSMVAVDRSSDFTSWTAMVTNMMPSGPMPIKDTNAASASQRFYRARLVQ